MSEIQTNETLNFEGRTPSDFWFACVDIAVIKDGTLSTCDKAVYSVICAHVDVRTRTCPLRVKTIAEEAGCSVRSAQESLKTLVERGVIGRTECFENGKQKASIYKLIGHHAPCYRDAHSAASGEFRGHSNTSASTSEFRTHEDGNFSASTSAFFTPMGEKNVVQSLREPNIYEIKDTSPSERGASSPPEPKFQNLPESPKMPGPPGEACFSAKETPPNATDDLITPDEAPPAMRETLDYFLLKTGRRGIEPEELSALRALEEIHTAARVNKEIAQAVERFGRNGKPLSSLTLVYIYKSLQYQNSLKNAQGKSPPQKLKREEDMPDPYEGCYL